MSDAMREFARTLFGKTDPDEQAEPAERAPGNVAPREGNSPEMRDQSGQDTRRFLNQLFGRDVGEH